MPMTPIHALSAEDALKALKSDRQGLTKKEAKQRLEQYGENRLEKGGQVSVLSIFLSQFKGPLMLLLVLAGALSLFLGEALEAAAIFVILLLNALLGFHQEYRAERAIEALQKISAPEARVRRDASVMRIPASELVPGDILLLEEGDIVAADARIIQCAALRIDESSLTGESEPSDKNGRDAEEKTPVTGQTGMAFSGTVVTRGKAVAIVAATGMATELGKIAQSLEKSPTPPTPLERKFGQLTRQIGILAGVLIALVLVAGFAGGGLRAEELVLFALVLTVSTIPNSLPLVVTVSLALGAKRLAGQKMLVKRLNAAESLGAVTVICTDKTGTLTKSEMAVTRVWVDGAALEVSGSGYAPTGRFTQNGNEANVSALSLFFEAAAECNDAEWVETNGKPAIQGDPTEGALLVLAQKAGIKRGKTGHVRVAEWPFDSERKRMSVVAEKQGRRIVFAKGAPDLLLDQCTHVQEKGKIRKMGAADKKAILSANHDFAKDALRVLALAYREAGSGDTKTAEKTENGLVFLGLAGMMDAPRPEVPEAVARCHKAGIKIIMITGDHAATAEAVGRKIGLFRDGDAVVDGARIDALSDAELDGQMDRVRIIARALPIQKLRIVQSLQRAGHVVAMTGDGVNDAPALKKADIGIAMGITGTDVAKEVAGAQLVDDNFASIVNAVQEGRNIYDKILKSARYLLSCNSGEIISVFLAMFLFGKLALLPLQVLLMNILTDDFPAIGLGTESEDKGIMDRPPRPPGAPPLSQTAIASILLFGGVMAAGTLFMFSQYQSVDLAKAQTVGFTTLVIFQLFAVVSSRSAFVFNKMNLLTNPKLAVAVLASFIIQVAVVHAEPLQAVFGTVALSGLEWALILAAGVIGFLAMEAGKMLLAQSERAQAA